MPIFLTVINDRTEDDARFYVRLTFISEGDWRAEVSLRGGADLFENDGYEDKLAARRAAMAFISDYLAVQT